MSWLAIIAGHSVVLFSTIFILFMLKDNPKELRYFEYMKYIFFGIMLITLFTMPLMQLGVSLTPTDVTSVAGVFTAYAIAMILVLLACLYLFGMHLIFKPLKGEDD